MTGFGSANWILKKKKTSFRLNVTVFVSKFGDGIKKIIQKCVLYHSIWDRLHILSLTIFSVA